MSDLEDFVLDFCRAVGGVVEPPAYGVYDVLLPDEVAAHLGMQPLQRFAFVDRVSENGPPDLDGGDIAWLSYGHPLVEAMIEAARARPACARFYLSDVRLDKHGLATLARSALTFPNAALVEIPRALETPMLFRYARFNFKAALVSDEKQEYLVSVLIDAQTGGVLSELPTSEAYRLSDRPAFGHLPLAPALRTDELDALAASPMRGLLEGASRAAGESLADLLRALQARAARHLELDRARLGEYYDDLERDLERRLARTDDAARRTSLQEKLSAARADRSAKLADIESKYHLHAELDLINVAVIAQPKIALQVRIEHRHAAVTRTAVWDPLRHVLEPFVCDVCHRPSPVLTLCANNHLAHAQCLSPQCVDCKRAYCRNCADHLTTCAVCSRPVCDKSLIRCRDCGRGTCRGHAGLCHAADGAPVKLAPAPAEREPAEDSTGLSAINPQSPEAAKKPEPPTPSPRERRPKPAPALPTPGRAPAYDWGYRLEVQIEWPEPLVVAFVLAKGGREIAQRSWAPAEDGIAVTCICEKRGACRADGLVLKPEHATRIEGQIEAEIAAFRSEYHIPALRMTTRAMLHGNLTRLPRLRLRGQWKDEDLLGGARARFLAEELRDHPEACTPLQFPDWAIDFNEAEGAAYLPDIGRFVQIAAGRLFYEGALPADELAELTASATQPGAWYSLERARDVFKADPRFKVFRGGIVGVPEIAGPARLLREKAACGLPPRDFTVEELLAAGDGILPLTSHEKEIERELSKRAPRMIDLRSIQSMFRNAETPSPVLAHLLDLFEPRDKNEADRLNSLFTVIWNHSPRYELRGRTPAEVLGIDPAR